MGGDQKETIVFTRMFANTPQKLMCNYLREVCPDPALWEEIQAYLMKGRRAKSNQSKAALKAYLELREDLGGLAAFRASGELTYDSLVTPCQDFACSYVPLAGMDSGQAMGWARFLLAADHLLALAYEASLAPGVSRKEQAARMEALFNKVKKDYLTPLGREARDPMLAEEGASRPPATAEAAAA
jgi:hypothetical protein